jgi:hypothetical protein
MTTVRQRGVRHLLMRDVGFGAIALTAGVLISRMGKDRFSFVDRPA